MNKLAKRLRKWRPRPYMDRRQKISDALAVLVVAGAILLPIGLLLWWEVAAIAILEVALLLLIPSRENRAGIDIASEIGVIDVQAIDTGDDQDGER